MLDYKNVDAAGEPTNVYRPRGMPFAPTTLEELLKASLDRLERIRIMKAGRSEQA